MWKAVINLWPNIFSVDVKLKKNLSDRTLTRTGSGSDQVYRKVVFIAGHVKSLGSVLAYNLPYNAHEGGRCGLGDVGAQPVEDCYAGAHEWGSDGGVHSLRYLGPIVSRV